MAINDWSVPPEETKSVGDLPRERLRKISLSIHLQTEGRLALTRRRTSTSGDDAGRNPRRTVSPPSSLLWNRPFQAQRNL
ncbi:hypothetical protein F0562_001818 [Nyssa sinensis]|uniref:Uncharacterized protein n=1 Tax=Nyssa sinensis TaxID=561372 RepID=A0A5J5C5N9_9ASTE|nr:hypothetical protein F0562_001818 [Nyssa sinensis]